MRTSFTLTNSSNSISAPTFLIAEKKIGPQLPWIVRTIGSQYHTLYCVFYMITFKEKGFRTLPFSSLTRSQDCLPSSGTFSLELKARKHKVPLCTIFSLQPQVKLNEGKNSTFLIQISSPNCWESFLLSTKRS